MQLLPLHMTFLEEIFLANQTISGLAIAHQIYLRLGHDQF